MLSSGRLTPGAVCQMATSRSGASNGSGFRSTPLTTLKIVAFAAMPTPSVTTATVENIGARARRRTMRERRLIFIKVRSQKEKVKRQRQKLERAKREFWHDCGAFDAMSLHLDRRAFLGQIGAAAGLIRSGL